MFRKILIANRGEIACRIVETARKLGIATVAVYSDADANARHVAMADEAVRIGPAPVSESYLLSEAVLAAARQTGAEAIHPGYGFLSENPEFAEACEKAGVVFIGPSAGAIRAMGLKDAAKALMEKAGVPVVPGYHGANQEVDFLAGQAARIGYPVLIKAVAGGGGKGMRLVESPDTFDDALRAAKSEAIQAFGNDAVLIEKFIVNPRHIEVQIFGDGTTAVHLYERDCSLQRRHQKVIEEAPAPGMTEVVRQAMGAAAVRAAEAIGYRSAGTVEFIVDGSGPLREDGFWFMEMNTRLQVEHPVTEAITGVDLVEWQLRVASGEALPKHQNEIGLSGHAFEARIYAEDVPAGFLPATGRLTHASFPKDARIDTGVVDGDDISPFYDPMIAKVTTHGATREVALARLQNALEQTELSGLTTNRDFLIKLARHEGFARGEVDTGLIARDLDALLPSDVVPASAVGAAALAVLDVRNFLDPTAGFSLWAPTRQRIDLVHNEHHFSVVVSVSGQSVVLHLDDVDMHARLRDGSWILDGTAVRFARHDRSVTVFSSETHVFEWPDPLSAASTSVQDSNVVTAPMPGLVRGLFVAPGHKVQEGEKIAILEAMKMEHSLTAPRDGTVADVLVAEGDQIVAGAVMVELKEDV